MFTRFSWEFINCLHRYFDAKFNDVPYGRIGNFAVQLEERFRQL